MALQSGEATKSGRCSSIWAVTLPQLSCSVPVVASALASLGSALEVSSLNRSSPALAGTEADKQYSAAIRWIQKEVLRPVQPRECVILSCLLLACAEIVQWRETDALTHVGGALTLLRARRCAKSTMSTLCYDRSAEELTGDYDGVNFTPKDELDLLFVQLDLQAASYALGLPPQLPSINLQYLLDLPPSQRHRSDLELETIQAVHSCYWVAHSMSGYKYLSPDLVPASLAFQQARHISQLAVYLAKLERPLNALARHPRESVSPPLKIALILRSQCLASLIYLSMTSNSHECGYDAYASSFRQIIMDAEILLASEVDLTNPFAHFSVGLGILQPLLLTAIKFRDPVCRRRAIALLSKGGREGPFHGHLLSAIASRAVDVEESYSKTQGQTVLVAADIAESMRLHGIGMAVEGMANSAETQVEVTLSRCRDVNTIASSGKNWDDPGHWNIWTETVYLE